MPDQIPWHLQNHDTAIEALKSKARADALALSAQDEDCQEDPALAKDPEYQQSLFWRALTLELEDTRYRAAFLAMRALGYDAEEARRIASEDFDSDFWDVVPDSGPD